MKRANLSLNPHNNSTPYFDPQQAQEEELVHIKLQLTQKYPIIGDYRKPTSDSPFKDLFYFEKEDAALFFGRAQEIYQLCEAITQYPFALLYGLSGVGKSSILNAGVWARLGDKFQITYLRREKERGFPAQIDAFIEERGQSTISIIQTPIIDSGSGRRIIYRSRSISAGRNSFLFSTYFPLPSNGKRQIITSFSIGALCIHQKRIERTAIEYIGRSGSVAQAFIIFSR